MRTSEASWFVQVPKELAPAARAVSDTHRFDGCPVRCACGFEVPERQAENAGRRLEAAIKRHLTDELRKAVRHVGHGGL